MQFYKMKLRGVLLVVMAAVTDGRLLAQQGRDPRPASPASVTPGKANAAALSEKSEAEAKLAKYRELVRPKPGEYVTNLAKIAWERDPWEAAVRAASEGKPVIAYGPGMVGIPGGHG